MNKTKSFLLLLSISLISSCDQASWITELPAGLKGGIYELSDEGVVMIDHNGSDTFRVNTGYHISLEDIIAISYEREEPDVYGMMVYIVPGAVDRISALTRRNIGRPLVFALNGIVYLAPTVTQEISENSLYLNFGDDYLSSEFLSALHGEKKPAFDKYNHDVYNESLEILSTDTSRTVQNK